MSYTTIKANNYFVTYDYNPTLLLETLWGIITFMKPVYLMLIGNLPSITLHEQAFPVMIDTRHIL